MRLVVQLARQRDQLLPASSAYDLRPSHMPRSRAPRIRGLIVDELWSKSSPAPERSPLNRTWHPQAAQPLARLRREDADEPFPRDQMASKPPPGWLSKNPVFAGAGVNGAVPLATEWNLHAVRRCIETGFCASNFAQVSGIRRRRLTSWTLKAVPRALSLRYYPPHGRG